MRLAIRGFWLARCLATFGVRVVDRNPVYAWRGSQSTSSKAHWLAYWHWNQLSGQSLDWNLVCGSVFPGLPGVAITLWGEFQASAVILSALIGRTQDSCVPAYSCQESPCLC